MATDSGNTLNISNANFREFTSNFTTATGRDPLLSSTFSLLSNVNSVYELYEELEAVLEILSQDTPPNLTFMKTDGMTFSDLSSMNFMGFRWWALSCL